MLETHGGTGRLYEACYHEIDRGIVCEINEKRAYVLARQRPAWLVCCNDARDICATGMLGKMQVDLVDIDPYGDPWPYTMAAMAALNGMSYWVVVQDGLPAKLKVSVRDVKSVRPALGKFGSDIHSQYDQVARFLVEREAERLGCSLGQWVWPAIRVNRRAHYAFEIKAC